MFKTDYEKATRKKKNAIVNYMFETTEPGSKHPSENWIHTAQEIRKATF